MARRGMTFAGPMLAVAVAVGVAIAMTGRDEAPRDPLAGMRIVELSHDFGPDTIFWPTAPMRFELAPVSLGDVPGGWFYSAFTFSGPEHGGTHLDAPYHFSETGDAAEAVPLSRLVAPAAVIDISAKAAADPDYRLAPEDVAAFEAAHGRIVDGSIVLVRTGWSTRWPDTKAYLGDDRPGHAEALHFPSFGEAAARLLVEERAAAALGIDTASTDYGRSEDFPVHRLMAAANVPGFENLTGLEALPPTGAVVIALPMKIAGGSGGPLRAVALVPETRP